MEVFRLDMHENEIYIRNMNVNDDGIKKILQTYKKLTVIGLSRDATKPAQKVPQFLRMHGYEIVGVHPTEKEIAGFRCYQKLADVPAEFRKFVDVFRPPKDIPAVVDDVLNAGGVEILFLQLGITHPESETRAEKAGIKVISDRCLHIELNKIL
jgi:predicted CoA-binding protein